jgi:organic radical activating enzyme
MTIVIASDKPKDIISYSEIFYSPQGEGLYTGRPTLWIRFFHCNLRCDGFGQKDPTDPTTYDLPYKDFDASTVNSVEQMPVFERGCDSSYSWAKKFRHLAKTGSAQDIVLKMEELVTNEFNPDGTIGSNIHLAFTGGEPMLNQAEIIKILQTTMRLGHRISEVTIETNGTVPMTDEFKDMLHKCFFNVTMSISPKLFNVSGELPKRALKANVVQDYINFSDQYQLKFVMNSNPKAWDEMESFIEEVFSEELEYIRGVVNTIWIMPVGATDAGQAESAAAVSDMAIARGYNVSARAHISLYGNAIGK